MNRREIKFRFWAFFYKEFYYWDLNESISESPHTFGLYGGLSEAQQYTGLKDKNGKDVYEGDIVTFSYYLGEGDRWDDKGEVLFMDGMFCFKKGEWWATNDSNFDVGSLEVVGNIFNNQELLS